jgi:hypothetical protein
MTYFGDERFLVHTEYQVSIDVITVRLLLCRRALGRGAGENRPGEVAGGLMLGLRGTVARGILLRLAATGSQSKANQEASNEQNADKPAG